MRDENGVNIYGENCSISPTQYFTNGYPKVFSSRLDEHNLSFQGYSLAANQVFRPPSLPEFYEPVVSFIGKMGSKRVYGIGFFETHLKQ